MPNSLRKTSSYQLPTAWCVNKHSCHPSQYNRTGLRTSPAHLEVTSKEECWGETAHAAKTFISRNVSETVCFRVLTFACNGQQRRGTTRLDNLAWEPFLFLMEQSWKKVIFFYSLCFSRRPTTRSIFCIGFRRKSPSDLSPGLKGREEKIYLYKKVKAQTHRFICWSSHSALSYSRQLLFYYQYLISI